jgi:hypothetical protein
LNTERYKIAACGAGFAQALQHEAGLHP